MAGPEERMTRRAALVPTLRAAKPGWVAPEPRLLAAPSPMPGNQGRSLSSGKSLARGPATGVESSLRGRSWAGERGEILRSWGS